MYKKDSSKIFVFGLFFLFFVLLVTSFYLIAKYFIYKDRLPEKEYTLGTITPKQEQGYTSSWDVYTNNKYRYSVSYPKLLYKKEFENQGGYLHFVRFEENNFSKEKGIAIGVRETTLKEEVARLKDDFSKEGKLIKEEEIKVMGKNGVRLEFEPKIQGNESRTLVILERENWVYSISTVPEQMDRVLESFKFL